MTNLWPRPRRTTGSGPPPNMRFGEFAYSDADGLIHVGRPDGSVRSYGAAGAAGPHTHDYAALVHGHPWSSITGTPATYPPAAHTHPYTKISLTPINGFLPLTDPGWRNELLVFPSLSMAYLRFAVRNPAPTSAGVLAWSPAYAAVGEAFSVQFNTFRNGTFNPSGAYMYVADGTLTWLQTAPLALDFAVGFLWFPYA